MKAEIYRRRNGEWGARIFHVIEDTGHRINVFGGNPMLYTVWSATNEDRKICVRASYLDACEAICKDWRAHR